MLTRLIDFFKMQQITAVFTSLTEGGDPCESTDVGVSSLMDTWLLLRDLENGAERNRVLHLLKSRGMAHSNQVREFLLTDHGVELRDVYVGPSGVLLTGSAREALEAQENAQALVHAQEIEGKKRDLERKRQAMEARLPCCRRSSKSSKRKRPRRSGKTRCAPGCWPATTSRWPACGSPMPGAARKEAENATKRSAMKAKARGRAVAERTVAKPARAAVRAAIVCGGHDATLRPRHRQHQGDLRGASEGALRPPGDRPLPAADAGRGDQIIALPTLIRKLPPPLRRIIGDLSDRERVLIGLDLKPTPKP